jgi:hypothetical protein
VFFSSSSEHPEPQKKNARACRILTAVPRELVQISHTRRVFARRPYSHLPGHLPGGLPARRPSVTAREDGRRQAEQIRAVAARQGRIVANDDAIDIYRLDTFRPGSVCFPCPRAAADVGG